ncbi:hypothetical protein AArcS_1291 [Natranaeroarchaeum sulfidigenes]|uniref:Zinc ribbon domain-containing protein n=1 Tax=Natranaeroarchaeum sulfidigenes TaxID=2784880 RepID=A0A897MR79_9EURY|nr:hypothetical protein AArcS_1291 [Natranaeroarchaeum sulfidigenes]
MYLGGAKTLGPEFRDFEGAKEVSAHRRSESETASESVDRREERDTTDCEGCGETIDASRTYCPQCRLELADLDQADGPDVVMDDSPEPDSLVNRSRNIERHEENGINTRVAIALVVLVIVIGAVIGAFVLL